MHCIGGMGGDGPGCCFGGIFASTYGPLAMYHGVVMHIIKTIVYITCSRTIFENEMLTAPGACNIGPI